MLLSAGRCRLQHLHAQQQTFGRKINNTTWQVLVSNRFASSTAQDNMVRLTWLHPIVKQAPSRSLANQNQVFSKTTQEASKAKHKEQNAISKFHTPYLPKSPTAEAPGTRFHGKPQSQTGPDMENHVVCDEGFQSIVPRNGARSWSWKVARCLGSLGFKAGLVREGTRLWPRNGFTRR